MQVRGVLESSMCASDLDQAESFHCGVLGLRVHAREAGRHVLVRCDDGMLLVFDPGRSSTQAGENLGTPIPAHGTRGAGHVAFRVDDDALDARRDRLADLGVPVESDVRWRNGAQSVYVRGPAGNSVEIATRKLRELDAKSVESLAVGALDHEMGSV